MRKALQGFSGKFRIGGRTISNQRYANDIVLLATSPEELQQLVSRVERAAKEDDMLINATKTKVMANNGRVLDISVDGGKLAGTGRFFHVNGKHMDK